MAKSRNYSHFPVKAVFKEEEWEAILSPVDKSRDFKFDSEISSPPAHRSISLFLSLDDENDFDFQSFSEEVLFYSHVTWHRMLSWVTSVYLRQNCQVYGKFLSYTGAGDKT